MCILSCFSNYFAVIYMSHIERLLFFLDELVLLSRGAQHFWLTGDDIPIDCTRYFHSVVSSEVIIQPVPINNFILKFNSQKHCEDCNSL